MTFSRKPEHQMDLHLFDRALPRIEPMKKFAVPDRRDLKEIKAGHPPQPVEISQGARYAITRLGINPQVLDEISGLCSELHYNYPERHAAEILSRPLTITPNINLLDIVFQDPYDWDPANPYGECSELKTRLFRKITAAKIMEKYGLDLPHVAVSGMSGHADKFFSYGYANHSWLGIHQFMDFAFEEYDDTVVVDPSLRIIKTLAESGYQLGEETIQGHTLKKVYPIEEDSGKEIKQHLAMNRIHVGLMNYNGSSFLISAPESQGLIKSDMILGVTHDYQFVIAMGLCLSVSRGLSYDWYLNIIDKNSNGVAQIVLDRTAGSDAVTGVLVAPLQPGFKPNRFSKKTIAQFYETLMAGEKARGELPHPASILKR